MRISAVPSLAFVVLLPTLSAAAGIRRQVEVRVEPDARSIRVSAVLTSDGAPFPPRIPFLLHGGMSPATATAGASLRRLERRPESADFGLAEGRLRMPEMLPVEFWELSMEPGVSSVTLTYGGVLDHPVEERGEDYARSFGETPGTVSPEGVILSGSSYWVPWLGEEPFPFLLEATVPPGWDAVSQGARTRHDRGESGTIVRWESLEPQTEIYLVAARFVESSRKVGRVEAMTFLRGPDEALAAKYLDATERYLKMYEGLLGSYPYTKFALVENFWETGYGMPSFTLLGSTVIRLPFIVNSSYPHEILHNWWGNGVYVDPSRGNWCEGLTAYLADHLLQEQSGDASEYRQTTLQKYADYVSRAKDFPLSEFRERHSPSTEAVGYGKSLMFFHELRRDLGDDVFAKSLRRFYDTNRFRAATFDDVRLAFEEVSGRDLTAKFRQAIDRTGAPRLALENVTSRRDGEGWVVEGAIAQTQAEDPFVLNVPLALTLEGVEAVVETTIAVRERRTPFSIHVSGKALRVDVDPAFDLFRRLDPGETPPALTRAFGSERAIALIPSAAPPEKRAAYRALVEEWAKAEPGRIEVKDDREVGEIPADRSVWILGRENARAGWVVSALRDYPAEMRADRLMIGSYDGSYDDVAAAIVGPHAGSASLATVWVFADRAAQVPGLGRKLPHYHKYSFVVFTGDEPTNVAKGRWPVLASPLTKFLDLGGVAMGASARREPLASPPPSFSVARIGETVSALSAPEMEGRAPGTTGHETATAWVERAFRDAGLTPVTDTWEVDAGTPPRSRTLHNVAGAIPGSRKDLERQVVVVGAHYDHLGPGRPGADDNASGVAALLELVRAFASGPPPGRSILFAAFDGEEAGRLGSRRLAAALARDGLEVHSMINLDSVGRLGEGKILVLGTGTASEWVHVFRGAGFVTGYPVESVAADPGGSDQVSFQEVGIPAVQLFTGPHLDYHAAGDTADKVDAEGIAKVTAVAREALEYLAGRVEPLTRSAAGSPPAPSEGGGRKVSLGTIPDFSFAGRGVRLDGVVPGSPAERAGLGKGDVIVALGDTPVQDLRSFSEALRSLAPGERVRVTFLREGETRVAEAEVVAR